MSGDGGEEEGAGPVVAGSAEKPTPRIRTVGMQANLAIPRKRPLRRTGAWAYDIHHLGPAHDRIVVGGGSADNSLSPLSGFTVRLWLSRQEQYSQDIIADAYYFNPQGVRLSVHVHPQNANIVYVDITYPDSFVLAAGTATDIDGAKLGLHFAGYYPGVWDRSNDWSWQGIDTAWRETPYATLYDRNGSLISGREPNAGSAPVPPIESTKALFGFENRSDWLVTGSAAVSTTNTKTEGTAALMLSGSGYITVQSRDFTSTLLDKASTNATVDIYLPANPVNPYWKGSVDLYADCPSGGVSSAYLGQVALTALPNGAFSTIQFTLSSQVKSLLGTSHRDLSFKFAVNSPSAGVVLDRFQVKP